MPAIAPYDMYCPIARALDVLGERWTLLILRDLANGEQRFTDLRRSVVGIPPNILSARLKSLVTTGLVTTRELPPPAARTVYTLTERGREAIPVLQALARWGFAALEPADPSITMHPAAVLRAAYLPFYDPAAAAGVDERYLLVIDGKELWLSSTTGRRPTDDRPADLRLDGPAWAFLAVRQAGGSLDDLIERGTITRAKGTRRVQRSFERVFGLTGSTAAA